MRIPWKKLLRIFAFGVIVIITLVALIATWFSYQGRKEWAKTRDELEARGEKLLLVDLAPPLIPAEENFFADPLWEELTATPPSAADKWQIEQLKAPLSEAEVAELNKAFPEFAWVEPGKSWGEVLRRLQKSKVEKDSFTPREAEFVLAVLKTKEPISNRIELLAVRPEARFPVQYGDGAHASLAHIGHLVGLARLYYLRALAKLALGEKAEALNDILMVFRLARSVENEPLLISVLVSTACNSLGATGSKQGIPVWSAEELLRLEEALSRVDLIRQLKNGIRGERASFNGIMDAFRQKPVEIFGLLKGFSEGAAEPVAQPPPLHSYAFADNERAFVNNYLQRWIDLLDQSSPAFSLKAQRELCEPVMEWLQKPVTRYRYLLTSLTVPVLESAGKNVAAAQNNVDQARIACALQRYWLDTKSLPESLENLMPRYLEKVPGDVADGGPMKYRRTGETSYLLWSIGSNTTDEQGVAGKKSEEDDWVWKGETIFSN